MFHCHRKFLRTWVLALCVGFVMPCGGRADQRIPQDQEQQKPPATFLTPESEFGEIESDTGSPATKEQAEQALRRGDPDSGQLLSADELSRLAARDKEPGDRVVGGSLTNQQLTYIVIALAAAVIVLIAK